MEKHVIPGALSSVSLQFDIWTAQGKNGAITVTASFLCEDFSFKCLRLGCPPLPVSHKAEEVVTTLNSFLEQKFSSIYNAAETGTHDMQLGKACRLADLLSFMCHFHTLELVLGDAKNSSTDVRNAFSALNSLTKFIRMSNIAREQWHNLAHTLPPHSGGGRMYTEADAVDYFFCSEEMHNNVVQFVALAQSSVKRYSSPPSFVTPTVPKADKPEQTTANPRYLSPAVREFFLLVLEPLNLLIEVQRRLSAEKTLTAHMVAPEIFVLRQSCRVAKDRILADQVPIAERAPKKVSGKGKHDDSHYAQAKARKMARTFLAAILDSIETRYDQNDKWTLRGLFPSFAHPAAMFIVTSMNLGINFEDALSSAKQEMISWIPTEPVLKKIRHSVPSHSRISSQNGASLSSDFMDSVCIDFDDDEDNGDNRLEPSVRVDALWKEYSKITKVWVQNKLAESSSKCSLTTMFELARDDASAAEFWRNFQSRPPPDGNLLLRFVKKYLPVMASQAGTERMGSVGRYLSYGNKSNVSIATLALKMLLGNQKDEVLRMLISLHGASVGVSLRTESQVERKD
jgi:hypothetical protein